MFKHQIFIDYLLYAFGGYLILYFIYNLLLAKGTKNWHSVTGTISYKCIPIRATRSNFFPFKHVLWYKYEVNGVKYTSSRVYYGDIVQSGALPIIEKIVKSNKKNRSETKVFYDPHNPASSVLISGVNPAIYDIPFWGLGIILFGILLRYIVVTAIG